MFTRQSWETRSFGRKRQEMKKTVFSILGILLVSQAQAAIRYGTESYPVGIASLRPRTFSGTVKAPELIPVREGVKLKLAGTGGSCGMVKHLGKVQREGEYLYISSLISNPTRSFVTVELQLYNVTDRRTLACGASVFLRNSSRPPISLTLEYTASKRDVGDVLELRWVQTSTENPSRTFILRRIGIATIRPMEASAAFPGGDFQQLKPAVFAGGATLPSLGIRTDDADNGDGRGDGAILVSSRDLGGAYGAVWKLGKVQAAYKTLHVETVWYAAGSSFVRVDVQLYNATTKTVLVSSGEILAKNVGAPPVTVVLDYALAEADKGCDLEVRWVQASTDYSSRNFVIDRLSVSESKPAGK